MSKQVSLPFSLSVPWSQYLYFCTSVKHGCQCVCFLCQGVGECELTSFCKEHERKQYGHGTKMQETRNRSKSLNLLFLCWKADCSRLNSALILRNQKSRHESVACACARPSLSDFFLCWKADYCSAVAILSHTTSGYQMGHLDGGC